MPQLPESITPDPQWSCWSAMIAGNPALPLFLAGKAMACAQGEKAASVAALRRWLKNSGAWLEEHDGLATDALEASAGLASGEMERASPDGHLVDAWYQRLLAAERAWFDQAPEAPVVVVRFQPQHDPDDGPAPDDLQAETWDGTCDFLAMDAAEREEACVADSLASDGLRTGACAPARAQEWEGPFAMSVEIHAPSAARVARRLARSLPAGQATPARPRM